MPPLLEEAAEAIRQLRRSPGFSLLAITLLALGLGATTVLFSLAHVIVLRPLPFRAPEELVGFRATNPAKSLTQDGHSASDFRDFATRAQCFAALGAYRPNFSAYAVPREAPVRLVTALVTENFFDVLGVSASHGRTFVPEEFSVAGPRAVVLSDATWRRHFHAAADVVGRTIVLDDEPHVVVGIMAPTFHEPELVDAWLPFPREAPEYFARDSRFWSIVARLKPGVTATAAQAEMSTIAADLAKQFPATNRDWSTRVQPLHELRTRGVGQALLLLSGAVGLVLLMACLNLANLLLARGQRRRSELALRLALGARPAQLARRVLMESTALALAGGIAGCALAACGLRLLVAYLPSGLLPRTQEIAFHPAAFAVAAGISVATGLLFGGLPAWQVLRTDINSLLKESDSRSMGSVLAGRAQNVLVIAQVALSFAVLTGSMLLMKSLIRIQNTAPGFNPHDVITLNLAPPVSRYDSNLDLARYYERLIDELATIPGVASAAVNASAPLCGIDLQFPYWVHGRPREEVGADEALYAPVSEDYFATLQQPLRRGRVFNRRDHEKSRPVAIINETLARRAFRGVDPIGQRILLLPWLSGEYREIVGVVADTRQTSLTAPPPAQIYVPQRQMPWFFSTLLIRLRQPDAVAQLREALHRADPGLPFAPVSLDENIARTATQPRVYAALFGIFGTLALGLAAFGIYASIRFTTARRTRELGIRLALGAPPAQIARRVIARAGRLVAWGLASGTLIAAALGRSLRSLVSEVSPEDPSIYVALVVILSLVAFLAALPTALRAMRLPLARVLQPE